MALDATHTHTHTQGAGWWWSEQSSKTELIRACWLWLSPKSEHRLVSLTHKMTLGQNNDH